MSLSDQPWQEPRKVLLKEQRRRIWSGCCFSMSLLTLDYCHRACLDPSADGGAGCLPKATSLSLLPAVANSTKDLSLAEGPVEGRHHWAEQIVERGALLGRDHHRDRHARGQHDLFARSQLVLVYPDERSVVGRAGTLVCQPVGRDVDDVAVDDRDHSLLVGGEVH